MEADKPVEPNDHAESAKAYAAASAEHAKTAKANANTTAAAVKTANDNVTASATSAQLTRTNAENSTTDAQKTKDNATSSTADAQLTNTNASNSTADARTTKTNAANSTADAQTTKSNASESSSDAQLSETNAENSTVDAEKTKTNAANSATDAQTTKTNATNSTADAELTKGNATTSTADAKTTKTNADNSTADAQTAKDSATSSSSNAKIIGTTLTTAISSSAKAAEELQKATAARVKAETEAGLAATAHNMSTTAGLAGAFTERARAADLRQNIWVGILVASLGAIVTIGYLRFDKVTSIIESLIAKNDQNLLTPITLEVFLSGLSLGAPIWLAWMSSRMISKYFHLSEDYSYKAALAKAYLGFKEQANKLDPIFEERLFAAAITQLDSNPLRFFDSESHPGSPLQDLFQQPFMQAAMKDNTFNEGVTSWFGKIFKKKFYLPRIVFPSNDTAKPPVVMTGTEGG